MPTKEPTAEKSKVVEKTRVATKVGGGMKRMLHPGSGRDGFGPLGKPSIKKKAADDDEEK